LNQIAKSTNWEVVEKSLKTQDAENLRNDPDIKRVLDVKWWDLELSDLSGLPFRDVEQCLSIIEDMNASKA